MNASLNQRLARCLADLRARKAWTLDELASISGVSRAALSRLENAEVSPSADVLARLAAAHGMSLSRLLAMIEDGFTGHVPRDDQPVWRDEATGFTRRMVSPGSPALGAEIMECKLPPGTELNHDQPAVAGQEHHIVVVSGYMQVLLDGAEHTLGPGDGLRFRQFGEARFVTARGQGARYMMTVLTR